MKIKVECQTAAKCYLDQTSGCAFAKVEVDLGGGDWDAKYKVYVDKIEEIRLQTPCRKRTVHEGDGTKALPGTRVNFDPPEFEDIVPDPLKSGLFRKHL